MKSLSLPTSPGSTLRTSPPLSPPPCSPHLPRHALHPNHSSRPPSTTPPLQLKPHNPPPSPSSSRAVSDGVQEALVLGPDTGVEDADDDDVGVAGVGPEAGRGGEEVGSVSGVEAAGIFSVDLGGEGWD
ncbi:hypothetical protein Droror1_Dr00006078 [Drosera rotundifolia]